MYLAIIGLAIAGLMAGILTDDSDDIRDEPETDGPNTETPPDPEDAPDLGVSVTENEDGSFSIEMGEDETGSLVALRNDNYEDPGHIATSGETETTVTLYLLPEGQDLPPAGDISLVDGNGAPIEQTELANHLGLEQVASWDLGSVGYDNGSAGQPFEGDYWDNRLPMPELVTQEPIRTMIYETDGHGPVYGFEELDSVDGLDDFTDGHVNVIAKYVDEDVHSSSFITAATGTEFSVNGYRDDDDIIVNPHQTEGLTLSLGAGDDDLHIGAAQSVLASDGSDEIDLTVVDYNQSANGASGGEIDLTDPSDSLTVHVPNPEDGPVYAVEVTSSWGEAARLGEQSSMVLIQAPQGSDLVLTQSIVEDFMAHDVNSHGLVLVSDIDLGTRTGHLGDEGVPIWTEGDINANPDIQFEGTLTQSLSISTEVF